MTTALSGEVTRVTFENEESGFRVVRVQTTNGQATLVGVFQAVGPGSSVRATGAFVRDPEHGEQFRVETLIVLEPKTAAGIERYLGSGVVAGVGPGFAKRIVEKFGADTLKIVDQDPTKLAEVPGLGAKRAGEIKRHFGEQRTLSSVTVILATHGGPPHLAKRLLERYGERAAQILERSPYRLALEVSGIGFRTADRMAQSLGIAGDHPERAQAGVVQELELLKDRGHVFCLTQELVSRASHSLGIGEDHISAAIDALWAAERVVVEDGAVFLAHLHQAETATAKALVELSKAPAKPVHEVGQSLRRFEREQRIVLDEQQRQAVEQSAVRKVSIITGGPGVGKTTILRALLLVFEQARLRLALAAPTGRAAKRLGEATQRTASTIHRLLDYEPRHRSFQRNQDNPLEIDAIIIDEASMMDIELSAALFQALPSPCRLVLVGDADQLPPVGPGAVLRDVISSERAATLKLTHVFRQSLESGIVRNAHRILQGQMPEAAVEVDGSDFFMIQRHEPESAARTVRELVAERIPKRFGFDPRTDIQVLCPMHKSLAGTRALNQLLQETINPGASELKYRGQSFRVGDKVMVVRNDYEKDVFNGDLGIVEGLDAEARRLHVVFDERSLAFTDQEIDELVLAYATTVHKSQGSEYPAVVMPLLTAHFVMLSRNLLYTAVTRARKLCVLVADRRALGLALGKLGGVERMTRLRERLERALPPLTVSSGAQGI